MLGWSRFQISLNPAFLSITLAEAAKQDFRAVKKWTPITSLSLYVKPEEKTSYNLVNGEYKGSIVFRELLSRVNFRFKKMPYLLYQIQYR